jgi:ribonucleotide monophosphatase NagD (HAD superfamily)
MVKAIFKEHNGYELVCKQFGKPTKETYQFAEDEIKRRAVAADVKISNFYMIGDNPESDIAGGNAKGWTTILVKTGVFKPNAKDQNDKVHPATHVVDDFTKAIDLIL